ncbi:MAG: UTP--glucose-1-phosphate uridylyltransferase [Deltaproteobacteria bacterium]|nr:UTP--glucose-1-phosphate uridylyltransferase [Deltaproteobacteria bacterium]
MTSLSAVIPVAGLGTRSLPASKSVPKEMLPVFDRPIIQYIVEEAVTSGAKNIVLVTSRGKSIIEDHFDIAPDLEATLKRANKNDLYKLVHDLSRMTAVQTVRQKEALGLGHAVWMAKNLIQTSPFGVMLGDDLVEAKVPGLQQLLEKSKSLKKDVSEIGVVMLTEVPDSEVSKYGICELDPKEPGRILRCIEKPKPSDTKSRSAILGRYLLPRDIFEILEKQKPGNLGEIQLTDALNVLAEQGRLYGCYLQGLRFDAGDRLGFLRANLHYYLKSPLKSDVQNLLKEFMA